MAAAELARELRLLAVARGEEPADLLLRGGQIVSVYTGEILRADVAVKDGLVAGIGEGYDRAREIVDVAGLYLAPGFIDGHVHIESSMLPVHEFARLCLVRGTTTVICDPHEIANVLGVEGIDYILQASQKLPLDVFLMAPSCVPATAMESAGARLTVRDVNRLLRHERVLGLAEMMNYPGAVFGDPEVLAKIRAARVSGRPVDGHAPGLGGRLLQAYAAAGIGSDHECVGRHEAREKLRTGLRLMVREGSAARNLTGLLPVVNDFNLRRCMFVTDDKHPEELLRDGHLDATLRQAVRQGMHPAAAVQMVTLNPAEYFGLADRGALAPGRRADIVVLSELDRFVVRRVYKSGVLVAQNGSSVVKLKPSPDRTVTGSVRTGRLTKGMFRVKAAGDLCRVIRVIPGQIVTEQHLLPPTVRDGEVVADPERDLLKLAVIERHQATGRVGLGLVAGFGIKQGALGTTVAHDSHNIIIVGTADADMLLAAKELKRTGGGMVAVAHGRVAASLALPVAGLMAVERAEKVAADLRRLVEKARVWGSRLSNPFATLSFLALPVIPELKLTDKGLVDVSRFRQVGLFVDD